MLFTIYTFASIPSGYYTTLNGKHSAALKTELHNILMQDTSRYYSYGSGANHTWNGFYNTDRDTITNLVIDMYSDSLRYFATDYITLGYPSFGQKIHIEHSLPKSWWGSHEWSAYKDLNHLYPAEGGTNLSKSDNPLGVVSGIPTKNNGVSKIGPAVYNGYVGNVFEPADQYKGDFARTYFYMATAYEHYKNLWDSTKPENMMQNNTYPVFKQWAIDLLMEWSSLDPVSEKELTRNEKVYSIQGNRNPFIDYSNLADYIWGNLIGSPWNLSTDQNNITKSPYEFSYNSNSRSVKILSTENEPLHLTVISLEGKIIYNTISTTNCEILLSNLNKGVYVIYSMVNNYKQINKIIL